MVAIVTDSAANLGSGMAHDLGIEIVPMQLNFGDRVYRDGLDMTPADFYQHLVRADVPVSTSMPSPAAFLEAFQRTGQREIVCVTVAAAMSAAHHQAARAAEQFDGEVRLVDSGSASMGQGFVAMEGARRAASGAGLDEVAARAETVAARTYLVAGVDTFEFLRRSGRVGKLQAYAATVLDIKPVFEFRRGDVRPLGRPRTRARATDRLVEQALREIDGRPVHLAAFHAAAPDRAEELAVRIGDRAHVVEQLTVEVTPVIGAHVGPGMVGVAFFCDESGDQA
jgi:DegV family protein with EDD domain